jgi:MoxR-like ATPase
MIEIRLAEATGDRGRDALAANIYTREFLIERPLLQALQPQSGGAPVLLIDELDRTDEPFEAYLLEILSDWQITIPELGTVEAAEPPIVIVTSNRTREIHDALKRRCFYYWVDYPAARSTPSLVPRASAPGWRHKRVRSRSTAPPTRSASTRAPGCSRRAPRWRSTTCGGSAPHSAIR